LRLATWRHGFSSPNFHAGTGSNQTPDAPHERRMMKKGDVDGARKVSQEAWDSFRTPKSRAIQNRLIACAMNKCKNEIVSEQKKNS
jgi:hypothetical protein